MPQTSRSMWRPMQKLELPSFLKHKRWLTLLSRFWLQLTYTYFLGYFVCCHWFSKDFCGFLKKWILLWFYSLICRANFSSYLIFWNNFNQSMIVRELLFVVILNYCVQNNLNIRCSDFYKNTILIFFASMKGYSCTKISQISTMRT